VAIVPESAAESVLDAMRRHLLGRQAALIGEVVADHAPLVVNRTQIGGRRIVDLPPGELLPRIC